MAAEFTSALARILTDARLRTEFLLDPSKVADRLGLVVADRPAFEALDVRDLERQAETLILKRFHEVRKRLPRTCEALGPEAERLFRIHADRFWPEGHERHLVDAVAFGEGLPRDSAREAFPGEVHRLRFELEGGRWALRYSGARLLLFWRNRKGEVRGASIRFGLPRFNPAKGRSPA